eukprot:gene3120-4022_t
MKNLAYTFLLACALHLPVHAGIQPGSAEVRRTDLDSQDGAPHSLTFTRHYRSQAAQDGSAGLGAGWTHNYAAVAQSNATHASVRLPAGERIEFMRNGTGQPWTGTDPSHQLSDTANGLLFVLGTDESRWQFDPAGKLQSITQRNGWRHVLMYDAGGRLASVTNAFGRSLQIARDAGGRIVTVTAPDASAVVYSYDSAGRLSSAGYMGGTTRQYHYGLSHLPGALTGVTGESGSTEASYSYDAAGRAIGSQGGSGAGAMSYTYPDAPAAGGTL